MGQSASMNSCGIPAAPTGTAVEPPSRQVAGSVASRPINSLATASASKARAVALSAVDPSVATEPNVVEAAKKIARYESRDPVTGRVWGMPSAFGTGQCLDCAQKAAPPSVRCEACQLRLALAIHELLPPQALQQVQEAFDLLLGNMTSSKMRDDIAERLQALSLELHAGRLSLSVQGEVHRLACAASAGDFDEANRVCTTLIAKHWDVHRVWLLGLKRLL